MSERKFEVAVVESRIRYNTQTELGKITQQRDEILINSAVKPPDTLSYAAASAARMLISTHRQSGIDISRSDIQKVLFIPENRKKELNLALKELYGSDFDKDLKGVSSFWNKSTLIFLGESDMTNLSYANVIYFSMFKSLGKQIVSTDGEVIDYSRIGYEIVSYPSPLNPWLLEEGLAAHEAARFSENISDHPRFRDDSLIHQMLFENLVSEGKVADNKVRFSNLIKVEPEYCWVELSDNHPSFTLPRSGIAGSFFELLASRFNAEERRDFFSALYTARINLQKVPRVAGMINNKWGRGTYSQLLMCDKSKMSVLKLMNDLKGRK